MSDDIIITVTEDIIKATVGQITSDLIVGVPAGGATGEVLKKVSGTDYDFEWLPDRGNGGGGTVNWGDILGTLTDQTDLAAALDQKLYVDIQVVQVKKTPEQGEFGSIKAAVDSISDAASNKIYVVKVGAGSFAEDTIVLKPYVFIEGTSQATVISPDGAGKDVIVASPRSAISNCFVSGANGAGFYNIKYTPDNTVTAPQAFLIKDVYFGAALNGAGLVLVDSTDGYANCNILNCTWGGAAPVASGIDVIGGVGTNVVVNNFVTTAGRLQTPSPAFFLYAYGENAVVYINGAQLVSHVNTGNPCIGLSEGAVVYVNNTVINNFGTGILALDTGLPTELHASSTMFRNCTLNLDIGATCSGEYTGYSEYSKTAIAAGSGFFLTNKDSNTIYVSKAGGDFASIAEACDSILDSSINNPYEIHVGAGVFTEPQINVPSYVSIQGSGINATSVFPQNNNHHVFNLSEMADISFLNINDAGSGYAGIYAEDVGNFGKAHKVSIYNCDIGVCLKALTVASTLYLEYVDINGTFTKAACVETVSGDHIAKLQLENFYTYDTAGAGVHIHSTGTGSLVDCTATGLKGDNTDTAVRVEDGAEFRCFGGSFRGFATGVEALNVGAAPTVIMAGCGFAENTADLNIAHPSTIGSMTGSASHSKITLASTAFSYNLLDPDDGELDVTANINVNFSDGTHTSLSTLVFEGSTMGLFDGGELTTVSGLTLLVAAGSGYADNPLDNGIVKRVTWNSSSIAIPAGVERYVYFTYAGVLTLSASIPNTTYNIVLGRVVANGSTIELIDQSPIHGHHTGNRVVDAIRESFGAIYKTGSIASEGGTAHHLNVTAGEYYFGDRLIAPSGGSPITFAQYYYNNAATWSKVSVTTVNNSQYNNGTTLANLTASHYTKHALYVSGDGVDEKYFLVLGQAQYSTLPLAQAGTLPTPPNWFKDSVALIALVYVQQGASNIAEIELAHPQLGYRAASTAAGSDHGNLTGLSDDDHQQYLPVTGSRAMAGVLDMGTNNISNVGTVDGVDVSAHASRHGFAGEDAFTKGTPAELTDNTNVQGSTNTEFAAGNHTHAHGQRGGGDLHALATVSEAGFLSNTDKIKLNALSGTNSGDVTLTTNGYSFVSATGQALTLSAVDLASDITGNLPISRLNSGTGATADTYWRGDGTWVNPLANGDRGDITISDNGATWTIDDGAVTNQKITSVAATKVTTDTTHRFVTDAQITIIDNTSGVNTGDQSVFSSIAVTGQSTVVADTTSDTITLVGTGVDITTNAGTDTIAFSNANKFRTVPKIADEARANNTTLTADSALQINLEAGKSYSINARIYLSAANANMDYKFDMNYTGALSVVNRRVNYTVAGSTTGSGTFAYGSALQGSTAVTGNTSGLAYIEFSLSCTASTSGVFSFRWAQNTADGANLTVLRGSYMEYAET